ncbi:hypothetical protein [Capillimicrobium parvum]|uniref:Uncharacterized protein n=1 Tax=Capillimicrobium parvum TaxID=2884022 RepID=A0A9E6XUZ0_9ACTN|nr:hypothetical protein [Capillimicrobium parvum]UGS34251.1 hypothetical protein DSM104329_00627 [Capillimicrobium parvum]
MKNEKQQEPTKCVSAWLPVAEAEAFHALAAAHDRSISREACRAFRFYLHAHDASGDEPRLATTA